VVSEKKMKMWKVNRQTSMLTSEPIQQFFSYIMAVYYQNIKYADLD
jgi:hypothetical protein